jgi:hypothetical protein
MRICKVTAVGASLLLAISVHAQQPANRPSPEEVARVNRVDPPIKPDPLGNALIGGAVTGTMKGAAAGAVAAVRGAAVGQAIQAAKDKLTGRMESPQTPAQPPAAGPTPAPAATPAAPARVQPHEPHESMGGLHEGGSRSSGHDWAGPDHASEKASNTA